MNKQIMRMAKGIPGAVVVMVRLLEEHPIGQQVIDILDEMKLYGSDIWFGYKDHCKRNLHGFASAVLNKDQAMLKTIQKGR